MTGILSLAGRGLHGLFQCDSRPQSGQRAGQTSLNQVLLLVEVDVELIEAGDLAALGRADGVVTQVDEDTQQVMLLAVRARPSNCSAVCSSLMFSAAARSALEL